MGKSRVTAKPISNQVETPAEKKENEMPQELRQPKIMSEIEYLKKMKLRAQIASTSTDANEKMIASFKTQDDERIETTYRSLIELYKKGNDKDANGNPTDPDAAYKLLKLYHEFGQRDLYSIAANIAMLEKVQDSNRDITNFSKSVKGGKPQAEQELLESA